MITDKNIATAVNIYLKSYELVLNQFQDPTFAVQTEPVKSEEQKPDPADAQKDGETHD